MADKLVVEIFKLKTADQFSKSLSEKDSRLEAVSAAAAAASNACALARRAALIAKDGIKDNERLDYIDRNLEIVRGYMVHLIDEDVKSRGPLNRARREGTAREIEACIQPATCIAAEVINMMSQCLGFMDELAGICPAGAMHYLGEAAELAMSALRSCRLYILNMIKSSTDDTYLYVTRKENQVALDDSLAVYASIIEKVETALK